LPSNDKRIHRQKRDLISLLYFFRIRKVGSKGIIANEKRGRKPEKNMEGKRTERETMKRRNTVSLTNRRRKEV
jgi:hypothetical protein